MSNMIASAIGYTLDFKQITNSPFDWWILTIGVATGFAVWIIVDLYKQNSQLLDVRPSIKVEPLVQKRGDGEYYYLKVFNNGAEGVFYAQLEFATDDAWIPSCSQLSNYQGYWRKANKTAALIAQGQDDWVEIARV